MITGNLILFAVGAGLAAALLAVGGLAGFRLGVRRQAQDGGVDRQRLLRLLQELGTWTSEYSGNVSRYQDQLGALSKVVDSDDGPSRPQVMVVLEEIMRTNQDLKQRLDAAELQLDKQTRQIESYLSEARTDALTGLANRRAFDQRLEELFGAYVKGNGRSFVLALIDIDHFKKINDQYGHQAGDDVLRQVASAIAAQIEGSYLVARFGGEEFAVLLPTPLRLAAERADKMRKAIAAESLVADGQAIGVSISVGLSELREDPSTAPLVRRADEALYAAKDMGRNRVYYHDGTAPALVGAPEVASEA
ncbi:GGDEF domain-containing protein [Roseimaritima sediminicola]|uniref:GGDEF domain-containing protein n=1 Tax=Roseimaritima sediminicola TaxID=2662066 RepID=UPI001F1E8B17|nr:GGDEF domain-containing protein [Roseimaritima sediminicola]